MASSGLESRVGWKSFKSLLKRWYAHLPISLPSEKEWTYCISTLANKMASLDLGICNLAALTIPNGNGNEDDRPVTHGGKAVLIDWVYRTKKISKLEAKLKDRHSSRCISLTYRRRQSRLRHAVNAMCRSTFSRLQKLNVYALVVGDLTGIRYNNNKGTETNQKLHNFWAFRSIIKRLKELG